MIEAKELRVGNYLYHQTLPIIPANFLNIEIIAVNEISDKIFNNEVTCQFAPIPLSEEWFTIFAINNWINNTFEIRKNMDNTFTVYGWKNGISIFICHLKYVHELQNFYYILKNEELLIKNS